jgi:hypothetical protein
VFEHSRFIENPLIDLEVMNPSILRWFSHIYHCNNLSLEGRPISYFPITAVNFSISTITFKRGGSLISTSISQSSQSSYMPQARNSSTMSQPPMIAAASSKATTLTSFAVHAWDASVK